MLAEIAAATPAPLCGNDKDASHPRWRFGPADGTARGTVEHFIAAGFLKAYQARLIEFMPELMGLYHEATLVAACGLRQALTGPLFLEQYLDRSVDIALSRLIGAPAKRSRIVEVGNLSVSRPGYARHFVAWLTAYLHSAGMHWALFSAVPALRNNFRRLGIPMITLGSADPDRLPSHVRASWGTYYDQQPQVTAVHVATALEILGLTPCQP